MRALILPIALLGALATPAQGQSLQVLGHAGYLGEWELTATVASTASSRIKEFTGPLKLTHVGICSQDGPEVKTGEIRFQLSGSSSRIEAKLLVDGVECAYSGTLADSYSGMMSCPDRRSVPLVLWLK